MTRSHVGLGTEPEAQNADGLELSSTYVAARTRFLSLAKARKCKLTRFMLPGKRGAEGEDLSCDIAEFGNLDSAKCLIISSGLHGIEGFCGSAVQCNLLSDPALMSNLGNLRVVLVHAVNPFGFSHFRRVNEDNIDLNRNFGIFSQPAEIESNYLKFRNSVFPETWRGSDLNRIRADVAAYTARYGIRSFQENMTTGQFVRPDDPYFGGNKPSWSRETWDGICRELSASTQLVAHLDIHTGLGESAVCEIIYGGTPNQSSIAMAKSWLRDCDIKVAGLGEGSSVKVTGALVSHIERYGVQNVGIGLEFGTVPLQRMLQALVADNWLAGNEPVDSCIENEIRAEMRECFVTDTTDWKNTVWQTARRRLIDVADGISSA